MVKKTLPKAIDRATLTLDFEKATPYNTELCRLAHSILEKRIKETAIKIHSIPSRIKSFESFLDKVDRYQSKSPFTEITDIVGLRVICLFLSDIENIGNLIKENFELLKEDDKIDDSEFTSFGYMSVHFIVRLGNTYKKTIYSDISEIPFEIQVRTIAMDAWANISHYLDYKTDQDIPKELKRDFYALNGMFYVADKHFQLFFERREEKHEEIFGVFEKGTKEDTSNQPINLDTLTVYLSEKFADRRSANAHQISSLVNELTECGYQNIGEIDEMLDKTAKAFEKYEEDHPPSSGKFVDVGVVRVSAEIMSDDFIKILYGTFDSNKALMTSGIEAATKRYAPYRAQLQN